jgi:hypothetical protein
MPITSVHPYPVGLLIIIKKTMDSLLFVNISGIEAKVSDSSITHYASGVMEGVES